MEKEEKKCLIIDIVIPDHKNVRAKEEEKDFKWIRSIVRTKDERSEQTDDADNIRVLTTQASSA